MNARIVHFASVHRGFSLIEVLVSIVILAIGLLGLAGLQVKANAIEMEAYQRSVSLMLVQDMASRIAAGRQYVTQFDAQDLAVFGVGAAEPARRCSPGMRGWPRPPGAPCGRGDLSSAPSGPTSSATRSPRS
jgi:prepilin-type N-terminal cleavage/methylation domain-containing protein